MMNRDHLPFSYLIDSIAKKLPDVPKPSLFGIKFGIELIFC